MGMRNIRNHRYLNTAKRRWSRFLETNLHFVENRRDRAAMGQATSGGGERGIPIFAKPEWCLEQHPYQHSVRHPVRRLCGRS